MRVAVVIAASSNHLSGVPRHGLNLVRSLLTQHEVEQVHLICAWPQRDFVHQITAGLPRLHIHAEDVPSNTLARNLWYLRELPRLIHQLRCDLVHLSFPVPVRSSAFSCPIVVTLHDLYPIEVPRNFGYAKAPFNRLILFQCLRAVDRIACVSETTMGGLERISPLLALAKAEVVPNAVEHWSATAPVEALECLKTNPFLLCVAQHRHNKNLPFLLHVFHRLVTACLIPQSMKLAIVGTEGPDTPSMHVCIRHARLTGRVVLLSGLTEAALQWCYENCEVLVAPSTHEGFGLPLVEALIAGARVVCSDIPAFREVGSSTCRYVSLQHEAERRFGDAVIDALRAPKPLPATMAQLSFSAVGERYLRLYRSLLRPIIATVSTPKSVAYVPKGELAK